MAPIDGTTGLCQKGTRPRSKPDQPMPHRPSTQATKATRKAINQYPKTTYHSDHSFGTEYAKPMLVAVVSADSAPAAAADGSEFWKPVLITPVAET